MLDAGAGLCLETCWSWNKNFTYSVFSRSGESGQNKNLCLHYEAHTQHLSMATIPDEGLSFDGMGRRRALLYNREHSSCRLCEDPWIASRRLRMTLRVLRRASCRGVDPHHEATRMKGRCGRVQVMGGQRPGVWRGAKVQGAGFGVGFGTNRKSQRQAASLALAINIGLNARPQD